MKFYESSVANLAIFYEQGRVGRVVTVFIQTPVVLRILITWNSFLFHEVVTVAHKGHNKNHGTNLKNEMHLKVYEVV